MRTADKRSPLSSIPGYSHNAVLQLIVASGTGYVFYHMTRIILLVAGQDPSYFDTTFIPQLALQDVHAFSSRAWVLITYGWTHNGFWELFSNMVWLYCFGTIIQTLVSYKQLIPLFVYSLLIGGIAYEAAQFIPGAASSAYIVGAQAGVFGIAVGALTLSPGYRFYLASSFSIPISVMFIIFTVLQIMNTNLNTPLLLLLAGGGLTGFTYVMLLRNGYQPGMWVYDMFDKLEDMSTPNEERIREKKGIKRKTVLSARSEQETNAQKKIDDILDKINNKGYNALTQEEKDTLLKASKDKDI